MGAFEDMLEDMTEHAVYAEFVCEEWPVLEHLTAPDKERLFAEIPGRAPGQSVVRVVADLGHPGQAEIASLGQDRGIEMAGQVRASGLATAGVLETTRSRGDCERAAAPGPRAGRVRRA